MKKIIVGLLFILMGVGCTNETWQGFYYPDGCLSCDDKYIYSPKFKDKEICLNWAEDLKQKRHNPDDLYECGKNCKENKEFGGFQCKETID